MLVRLAGGRFAVIDSGDAEAVGQHTWCAAKATKSDTLFYAVAKIDGQTTKLHRFLWLKWGLAPAPRLDHKDGDSLNCRRGNIRPCTQSQNLGNSKIFSSDSSGFKGVSRHRRSGRWTAQIKARGVLARLGQFDTPGEAAAAYAVAARAAFGEFARVA